MFEEHQKIIAGERNPEWRAYYNMLWHVGGSQSDTANLRAEDVDWQMKVISFCRMKTGSAVQLHFGEEVANILSDLPGEGYLFPNLARKHEKDRAKQFKRFAQEALGHNSVAVHRAYAKQAKVKIPSLEEYEKKSVPLRTAINQ